eukprot:3275948-Pleurochrysis_carterae.AAC.2
MSWFLSVDGLKEAARRAQRWMGGRSPSVPKPRGRSRLGHVACWRCLGRLCACVRVRSSRAC